MFSIGPCYFDYGTEVNGGEHRHNNQVKQTEHLVNICNKRFLRRNGNNRPKSAFCRPRLGIEIIQEMKNKVTL